MGEIFVESKQANINPVNVIRNAHSVVVQTACGWTEEDSGLSELHGCLHGIA